MSTPPTPTPAPVPVPLVVPGLTNNPLVTAILTIVSSIVTEITALALITDHTAQVILGIAGILVPLGVLGYDSVVRHTHAKAGIVTPAKKVIS